MVAGSNPARGANLFKHLSRPGGRRDFAHFTVQRFGQKVALRSREIVMPLTTQGSSPVQTIFGGGYVVEPAR
jgi:hypothetical protein